MRTEDSNRILVTGFVHRDNAASFTGSRSTSRAFGSIWVTTISPPRLLRLDPATRTVTGSLDLPSAPWSIEAGTHALWLRVDGSLLSVVPQN
jgi:hypothetical protein